MQEPIRILIVDDSRIFRGVLRDALADFPDVAVVGSVWNGVHAMEFLRKESVDLVTLDLEMPAMGGLETLCAIQQFNGSRPDNPPVSVLLVSAHTREGAAVTVEGLQGGAFDFVTKPAGANLAENLAYLKEQFAAKLRIFKSRRRSAPGIESAPVPNRTAPRPTSMVQRIRALFIGVSTGGPAALASLLPDLTARVPLPTLIVQHMPAGFTHSLAESLARKCSGAVVEAEDRQPVQPNTVYIAPGGRHMLVRAGAQGSATIVLNDQPPQNNCRPSADVLFRSAAAAYGSQAIGIILTGMGCDGTEGLAALHRAGAYTFAQDEASSVVWGMPGSAIAAGGVDEILPLAQIAAAVEGRAWMPGRGSGRVPGGTP